MNIKISVIWLDQSLRGFTVLWLGLILSVVVSGLARAEVPVPCEPEPTVQVIQAGDFLDGTDCVIKAGGDSDIFRFWANFDEHWWISGTDQGFTSNKQICIQLTNPNGDLIDSGCKKVNVTIEKTIEMAGIHSITVTEQGAAEIRYGLVLERLAPSSPGATPLSFGEIKSPDVDGEGDADLYVFRGTLGDVIRATATDRGLSSPKQVCIRLSDAQGNPTSNGNWVCGDVKAVIDETIAQSELHTLLVKEAGAGGLLYSVDLQCRAGDCRNSAALTPKTLLGLGQDGGGWIEIKEGVPPYDHLAWIQVNWPPYNASNGETRPIWCDVDGDNKDEVVIGLGEDSNGWLEIKKDVDEDYDHSAWIQVNWSDYNTNNGETFPTCRDVDSDNRDELLIGLGTDSKGWIEVKDDAIAGYTHLEWLRLPYPTYNDTSGETHPAASR